MIIEETVVDGYRTCAADRLTQGDCRGYQSEPIQVRVETTTILYADAGASPADPDYARVSHTLDRLQPADESDRLCPYCQSPTSISLEPRPSYRRLSPAGPDQLVREATLERERGVRADQTLAIDDRANEIAQQQLIEAKRANDLAEQELLERREANLLAANGIGEPEPPPRPRKRVTP